jgi:hypothetical protein
MFLAHSDDLLTTAAHSSLDFLRTFKVFILLTVVNSQRYNGYSPLRVVSYWLVENPVQETGSRAGEWQNMAEVDEINTVFC